MNHNFSCCSNLSVPRRKSFLQSQSPLPLNPLSKIFLLLSSAKISLFFLFFILMLLSVTSTNVPHHFIYLPAGVSHGLWAALSVLLKKETFLENLHLNVLMEKEAVRNCLAEKKEELFVILKNKGFDPSIAEQLTEAIALDSQTLLKVLIKEKFNAEMNKYSHPAEDAFWLFCGSLAISTLFSGCAFLFSYKTLVITSCGTFFIISYLKSLHTETSILKSLIWNIAAAATALGVFFFLFQALQRS